MLEHIVKNGETIYDILNIYHLELEEIEQVNLHITDLFHLASGMKIRIPLISKEIEQILDNTESFVQKYYPKVHDIFEEPQNMARSEDVPKEKIDSPIATSLETEKPSQPIQKPMGRPYPGILPPKGPYRG